MTRHTTILAGKVRRLVRVEHRRKRKVASEWPRLTVHVAGTAAVEDALCPMGGVMTGDRLKALAERKGPISSRRFTRENASGSEGLDPISTPKMGSGITPSEVVAKSDMPVVMSAPGLLADDVCRHIWTARGRFAPILYGEGL